MKLNNLISFSAVATIVVMTSSFNVEARSKGLSGDLVVFRCGSGKHPPGPMDSPNLIISLSKEMANGQPELLVKRSDFSLTDTNKIFGKAKQFSLTGTWPGTLTLTGFLKGSEQGQVMLTTASYPDIALRMHPFLMKYPNLAIVKTTSTTVASSNADSCSVGYLTPLKVN